MLYIISDQSALIAEKIIEKLGRGVTGLQGRGMYTNQDKTILICVISPRENCSYKRCRFKKQTARAFVIVNDSRGKYWVKVLWKYNKNVRFQPTNKM